MKLKVQAQHLQPGDIVGSGETVNLLTRDSIKWGTGKVQVELYKGPNGAVKGRYALWGKYTEINIERPEKEKVND